MKAQLSLLEEPPYVRGSETSADAAVQIAESAKTLRAKVLRFILDRGEFGATDIEIQDVLKMNPSTQRPRRIELVGSGDVVDSGKSRLTPSGRKATVWVAVQR
jgi:hypothetical protein